MAKVILESPWFSDGMTRIDRQIVWGIRNLYDLDHSSISTLTSKPWFKDGLSYEEFRLVGDLGDVAYRSETHFLAIIDMPFLETFEPADALAARSLRRLACCGDGVSERFRRVMAHPTISDGISDEEATIVATLHKVSFYSTDILDALLDPDVVTLEERTIDLPHTGETQLTIIRIRPGSERTMALLEQVVRFVEGFMGYSLSVRHVIYLTETAESAGGGASNILTNLTGVHEIDTDEYPEVAALHVFAHEIGHYYWRAEWSQGWISEGLATFFQSLRRRQADVADGEPVVPIWPPHWPPCPYVGNIAGLDRLDRGFISESAHLSDMCSYSFGERLFQDLWRSLGESVFRQGLANLYLIARGAAPDGECEAFRRAGICQVEAAFKAAAPADAAATVETVIARWHDNSKPYDLSHVDASPSNPNLPGGVEITRAYISLDRDRPEETRTNSFSASEIQEQVFLHLHLSASTTQQARELPLTFVEYFEDGFAYKSNDVTYTFNAGWTQNSLSFRVGPWTGYTWVVGDAEERTWATGRHWVYVYHEGQKVAEVEFQVTP